MLTPDYSGRFVPIKATDRRPVDILTCDRGQRFMETRCCVYRFFNPAGALLYVGIANDTEARFKQHADDSPWWEYWAWYTRAWYPNRTWAAAVDAHAIVAEFPAFNVAGRPDELNYPWGRVGDDEWDYEYRWDGFTLNMLYGDMRRALTLERIAPRRMEVEPEVAVKRYDRALNLAWWGAYLRHDVAKHEFDLRERAGNELLASRMLQRGRLQEVAQLKSSRESAAAAKAAMTRAANARMGVRPSRDAGASKARRGAKR